MKSLSWIATAISAIAGFVNPWLTVFGLIIVYLIVKEICNRDIIIADINANAAVQLDNNSKKHNKKNR